MNDKLIYTFRDNAFYTPLIKAAEELEQKRLVDLYNHYHKTRFAVKDFINQLNEIDYDWKVMYIDLLNGLDKIEINLEENPELAEEWFKLSSDLTNDMLEKQQTADLIASYIKEGLYTSSRGLREASNKEQAARAFGEGLKTELDKMTDRFLQIKKLDPKARFMESEGSWRLELMGDYKWNFSNSGLSH
jgi:hypothetical protein